MQFWCQNVDISLHLITALGSSGSDRTGKGWVFRSDGFGSGKGRLACRVMCAKMSSRNIEKK
jgi:hypothetical protein